MCGITGFLEFSGRSSPDSLTETVTRMTDTLTHRGPDGSGVWVDAEAGVALGHRRLSIVDLSEQGRQPMVSGDGSLVLTFNGEIYNHRALRQELLKQGCRFRGHSDTEVLLEALATWGLEATLPRCIGMFALAVWDSRRRSLFLVRDRLGIKPLYYSRQGSGWLFGSELKALHAHPAWQGEIDRDQVLSFLQNGYVSGPGSIYRNTWKLPPGCVLEIPLAAAGSIPPPRRFWNLTEKIRQASIESDRNTPAERLDQLHELLRDAVSLRLLADVPVGTFLSGGIDSSLITAVARDVAASPVTAFTIGFEVPEFDESAAAEQIARHLGVPHRLLRVTSAEAREVIPALPELFDEPFGDSSQIPTLLVSRLARSEVTVCLSGDGGDELFCGYSRYAHIAGIRRKLARLPRPLWRVMARAYGLGMQTLGRQRKRAGYTQRLCATRSDRELYCLLNRHWQEGELLVPGASVTEIDRELAGWWPDLADFRQQMSGYDAGTYLPDDILAKVDRASMAVALEARVPLLDHRLVELAWQFPVAEKVRDGVGKQPLRLLLERSVPRALFDRPKMGFGVPLAAWLRGPLRDWGEDLLSEQRLRSEGWLNPAPIRDRWQEHQAGSQDWHYPLWNVLMFQSWLRRWG